MDGMIVNNGSSTNKEKREDLNITAILDSGATLTYLPEDLVKPMREQFGLQTILAQELIDCKYRNPNESNTTVEFSFQDKTIKVPIRELTVELPETELLDLLPIDTDNICIFGIQNGQANGVSSDTFAIIGDTVLRSAYVVYDVANNQVGLAQANVGSSKSDIHELKQGKDFPNIRGVTEDESDKSPKPTGDKPSGDSSGSSGDSSDDDDDGDNESSANGLAPGRLALAALAGWVAMEML